MYNIVARQPYTLQSISPDISSTHLTPYRVTTKLCFLIFLFELFYNCSLETLSVGICVCVCVLPYLPTLQGTQAHLTCLLPQL